MGSSKIWDKYIPRRSVALEMGQISRGEPSEITHFQYNKSGIYLS